MLGSFYFIVCSTEFVVCRRDGVLGRQADDHDDANLHVDAVQEAAGIGVEQGRQLADDDKQKIICKLKKGRIPCGTRPSSNTNIEESRCVAIGLSLFLLYYIGQIKQMETMFAEGILVSSNIVSFFAKNPPDFHKWPYETFFIIL